MSAAQASHVAFSAGEDACAPMTWASERSGSRCSGSATTPLSSTTRARSRWLGPSASAEHDLFERYARRAQLLAQASGAITVLVSHRFSTVRMADLVVVVENGRVTETGDHQTLMAGGGLYAELFTMQSQAYA